MATLEDRVAEMRATRLNTQLLFWRQQIAKLEDPKLRAFAETEAAAVEIKIREAQDDLAV